MPSWTLAAKQKQSKIIRKTKLWNHSTGAKTIEGKKASSVNALKHGFRSADAIVIQKESKQQLKDLKKLQDYI